MLLSLAHQVDPLHTSGPVIPSATTELAAQLALRDAATDSLQALAAQGGPAALAAQGGPAALAAQQAQTLITQAQRAFIENAGDPDAVVAAQQQLLSAAMAAS